MKQFIILTAMAGAILLFQSSFKSQGPATKEELGRMLFFDPILSADKTISCASCHKPDLAFADSTRFSEGVGGHKGNRNTPSAMNMRLQRSFFWDGRARTLEEQALAPIENPNEMNLPLDIAIQRLRSHQVYRAYFQKVFQAEPSRENLGAAIAAFERTLETSDSPFDKWKFTDDTAAVSEAVKRGFEVFNGKGKCVRCHFGADFTENDFRNIGLFDGKNFNDSGRALITHNQDDLGRFKTPGLRNIALTAPYMHNGIFANLRQVIDFYDNPEKIVPNGINRDTSFAKPLGLTIHEKADLEAFLRSLTDQRFLSGKE
jgi:cytochrome c peroxidase